MQLSDNDKKYLLSIKPEDITFKFLTDIFGDKGILVNGKYVRKPSKINLYAECSLKAGEYFNKSEIKRTTAGQIIYNKFIIERDFPELLGYVVGPIDGGGLKKIEAKLSEALLNDKITVDAMVSYLNRTQWLLFKLHDVICGSFTPAITASIPKVLKERDRLFKENKEALEAGDITRAVKIENQLVEMAKKELGSDVGMDLYKSGARGKFENNYKNTNIMKGGVFNPTTGKYDIVQTSFLEGIEKKDIPVYGNTVISGAYPKAIGTAVSGYFSKQIMAALQAVVIDKLGTDCGTKKTLKLVLTKTNKKDFIDRYIVEGSKYVLLDSETIEKYIGKTVNLRSPQYCVGKKLCRICVGRMYEKLGIDNIGLTAARVSSTMLNLSMKKFHDSTAKIADVKVDELII